MVVNTDYIFIRMPSESDRSVARRQAEVIPMSLWLVGVVLLIMIVGAAVWCLKGTVTRRINVSGVVFPQFGIEQVSSQVDGVVSYVQVEVGDTVEAGDLIAIIPQTELLGQMRSAKAAGETDNSGGIEEGAAEETGEGLAALYDSYQSASMVYTPVSGRVVDLVRTGQHVQRGDLLVNVTNGDNRYSDVAEIRAYVSVTVAQSIKKGMEVRVYPQFSSDEDYGYIQGLVSDISSYPITETDISEELGRFYSSDNIPRGENIIEIRVTLLAGSDRSTLSWSGTEGDHLTIDTGTLCAMEIIISEKTPWEFLWSR